MTNADKLLLVEAIEALPEKDRLFVQGYVAAMLAKREAQEAAQAQGASQDANNEVA